MLILYNVLLVVTAFFWLPWMLIRAGARKEKPNWAERAGDYRMPAGKNPKRIWIHAVSVGEVVASMPILKELRSLLPGWEIVLSVTTSSGHQTAREKAVGLFDHLVYFPLDLPRFTVRAMARVKPAAVAVMETELWYNFLWTARSFEARTLLVNGRISDRSFRRSRTFRFFFAALLGEMEQCLMQTEEDARRIQALGGRGVRVLGNCKFDQAVDGVAADGLVERAKWGAGPDDLVVVVGSTRGEEDEGLVLDGLQAAFPSLEGVRIIHAPRHLER
ncbi:MAG: hypothetical protein MH204_04410, partial [Fimbriimonadaceae bacterium]|nr:hypothetical protein [Fimbriimonadaceae bacterium]